jgi:sulfur carrier protein
LQKKSSLKRIKLKFVGGFDIKEKEKELEVEEGTRYSEILSNLGINPETVVLVKDNVPIPIDDFVEDGEVVVMRVISGG